MTACTYLVGVVALTLSWPPSQPLAWVDRYAVYSTRDLLVPVRVTVHTRAEVPCDPQPQEWWVVGVDMEGRPSPDSPLVGPYQCFERDPDLNGDGIVNLGDFAIFGSERTDLDGNGEWSLADFILFASAYHGRRC